MRRSLLLLLTLVAVVFIAADPPPDKEKKDPADKDQKGPVEKDKKDPVEKDKKDPVEKDKKDPGEKDKKAPLTVGNDLPGPFHPYNVNGPRKGNYSCPVSATGLNAGLLVFVRGELEAGEAFKELLQKLDNAVEKNPNVRFAVHVVYVPDDLKDVVAADDDRNKLAGLIENVAAGTMLKHVVLTLIGKEDVEAYGLKENAVHTIVAYYKVQVRAAYSLEKDKLTTAQVQEILTMLGEKFSMTRK